MSLPDWDSELAVVAKEIEALRAAQARSRLTGPKGLVARKVRAIQAEMRLEQNLGRLKRLTTRELLLPPHEKVLKEGAQRYLDHIRTFTAARSELWTRSLWLKLIKTRLKDLADDDPHASDALGEEDLVSLAIRHESLQQTETYLNDTFAQLTRRRDELVASYQELGVAEANRTASMTLGIRLGQTPSEALASPPMRALGAYVKTAVAPIVAAAAAARLSRGEARITQRTDGLLGLALNLVAARLKDPAARPPARANGKFAAAMRQLDDLEDETRRAYDLILAATLPPAHPTLAKGPAER